MTKLGEADVTETDPPTPDPQAAPASTVLQFASHFMQSFVVVVPVESWTLEPLPWTVAVPRQQGSVYRLAASSNLARGAISFKA